MPKAHKVDLQIRGVPSALRDRVRQRARSKGVSMSRYVIQVLSDGVERPATINDWLDEVMRASPVKGRFSAAGVVREIRNEQEEGIED